MAVYMLFVKRYISNCWLQNFHRIIKNKAIGRNEYFPGHYYKSEIQNGESKMVDGSYHRELTTKELTSQW